MSLCDSTGCAELATGTLCDVNGHSGLLRTHAGSPWPGENLSLTLLHIVLVCVIETSCAEGTTAAPSTKALCVESFNKNRLRQANIVNLYLLQHVPAKQVRPIGRERAECGTPEEGRLTSNRSMWDRCVPNKT